MSTVTVPTFGPDQAATSPVFNQATQVVAPVAKLPDDTALPTLPDTYFVPLADGPALTGTPAGWKVETPTGEACYFPYWTK